MITVLPTPWRCTAGHNCSLRRRKADLDTGRWFHKDVGICEMPGLYAAVRWSSGGPAEERYALLPPPTSLARFANQNAPLRRNVQFVPPVSIRNTGKHWRGTVVCGRRISHAWNATLHRHSMHAVSFVT